MRPLWSSDRTEHPSDPRLIEATTLLFSVSAGLFFPRLRSSFALLFEPLGDRPEINLKRACRFVGFLFGPLLGRRRRFFRREGRSLQIARGKRRDQIQELSDLGKRNPRLVGPLGINLDEHGLWISPPSHSKGEFLVTCKGNVGVSLRQKSVFDNMWVFPLSGPMVKDLRRRGWSGIHDGSGDLIGVKTNLVIDDMETTRLNHQDFSDIGLSHIGPAFLFLHRLEEFLEGNKPIRVGYQTKLVRAAAQDVAEQLGELIGLTSCH